MTSRRPTTSGAGRELTDDEPSRRTTSRRWPTSPSRPDRPAARPAARRRGGGHGHANVGDADRRHRNGHLNRRDRDRRLDRRHGDGHLDVGTGTGTLDRRHRDRHLDGRHRDRRLDGRDGKLGERRRRDSDDRHAHHAITARKLQFTGVVPSPDGSPNQSGQGSSSRIRAERVVDLLGGDDQRRQEAQRRRPRGVDDQPLLEQRALAPTRARRRRPRPRPSARARARRARRAVRAGPRAAARPARARRARNASSSITSSTALRGRRDDRARPRTSSRGRPGANTSAQPLGRSPARRSAGRRRGPWPASSRPARRRAARTPTASRSAPCRSGPRRTRAPRRPRRRPRGSRPAAPAAIRFTPDSPWTGSISTAAVFASTDAGISAAGTARKPGDQRRERRLLGLLRRRRQRAVGAPVERVVGDDHVAARARLADELDRGLVGLGARVAEEHDARRATARPAASASATLGAL